MQRLATSCSVFFFFCSYLNRGIERKKEENKKTTTLPAARKKPLRLDDVVFHCRNKPYMGIFLQN